MKFTIIKLLITENEDLYYKDGYGDYSIATITVLNKVETFTDVEFDDIDLSKIMNTKYSTPRQIRSKLNEIQYNLENLPLGSVWNYQDELFFIKTGE